MEKMKKQASKIKMKSKTKKSKLYKQKAIELKKKRILRQLIKTRNGGT